MRIPTPLQAVFGKAISRILDDPENQYIINDVSKSPAFQKAVKKSDTTDPTTALDASRFFDLLGGHIFDRYARYAQSDDKQYKVFDEGLNRDFNNSFLRMVGKLEPCQAIKQRRWGLITSITNRISTEENQIGLRVRNVYPSKKTDKGQYEELLVRMWRDTFFPANSEQPHIGDFFGQWQEDWFDLGRFVAAKTYVGNNYNATLSHVRAFDADLVRRIVPDRNSGWGDISTRVPDLKDSGILEMQPFEDRYRYIVYNTQIESLYKTDETAFYEFLRRPWTDTNRILRGRGVVESALMMMEAFRESIKFNKINLSENRNLNEILFPILKNNEPSLSLKKVEELTNLIHAHMTGITGKGSILVAGRELGKLDFTPPNMEMQMEKWVTILCTFICAIAEEDPNELGLPTLRGSVEKGSMIHNENMLAQMLDRNPGLKSFMADALFQLNNYGVVYENGKSARGMIEEMTGEKDLFFDIVADVPDQKFKQDMIKERLSTHTSIREARLAEDLDVDKALEKALTMKLEDGEVCLLDIPGIENPQVANAVMQVLQMNAPQPEMGEDGMPVEGVEGEDGIESVESRAPDPMDQAGLPDLDETPADEKLQKALVDVGLIRFED